MTPDAVISVRFLTTSEGGRNAPVEGQFYSCPLFIENQGFDCRLLLAGRRLELGKIYDVPIKFLYREDALPNLGIGKAISLWEGRHIAEGRVLKVIGD